MVQNEYELTVLLQAGWSAERVKKLSDKITEHVQKAGGTVLHNVNVGKKELAYEINKEKRALYLFLNFIAPTPAIATLEGWLRYEDGLLRFLTVQKQARADVAKRQAEHDEDLKKMEYFFTNKSPQAAQIPSFAITE